MYHQSLKKFKAFVGIDWADKKHDICLQPADSDRREFSTILHSVEEIDEWALTLHKRFGGPIAVAIELTKGPIVSALQKYDFIIIYPINPTTLSRYREAFSPSGAKDDPTDAELGLDLMQHYPERFKPVNPQSPDLRKLLYFVEQRRRLVDEKKAFVNRLIDALKQYYPQILDLFSHRDTVLFCDLVIRWPSLQKLKRVRRSTLVAFFSEHNARSNARFESRYKIVKNATPLTEDSAVIMGHQLYAVALAEQVLAFNKSIRTYDTEIEQTFTALPDAHLFSTLPAAGPCFAPRLLVAFGEQRERFGSASEVQQYAGIAPVTERSGTKEWIHWRWQCPKFMRQTFVEWSAKTVYASYWAGIFYQQKRAKGCSHNSAVRALAFKWIRILFRCWKTRKPYNEAVYLKSLKERGSPLLST